MADQLKSGVHVRLRGKPGRYGFDVKSYDVGEGEATKDFAPVYPASEEITPKRLRTLVTHASGTSSTTPTRCRPSCATASRCR